MAIESVKVPDIGGAESVDVIEISVAVGDTVEVEESLIVLETDKASMEIPSTVAGTVVAIKVNEGDKISEGDIIVDIETSASAAPVVEVAPTPASVEEAPIVASAVVAQDVCVPDIGGAEAVDVIEICVNAGDTVSEGDSLIVLETDKASMEIPAPADGKVLSMAMKEGDKVSMGDVICALESAGESIETPALDKTAPAKEAASKPGAEKSSAQQPSASNSPVTPTGAEVTNSGNVYAGPSVRKLARQLGVDLAKVNGSGPRERLTKDDVRGYVKNIVNASQSGQGVSGGSGIPAIPAVDFAKFGDIDLVKMSKVKKITAHNMSRNWLNVPHVTQWDDADITDVEVFRKGLKAEAEKRGSKLTPLPFLLKAVASALVVEPSFNVSLHHDGEHIVQKNYVHIGVAVDTPNGLMVPVVRDVDKKGLWELTDEINAIVKKARDGKLMPVDMQGGCFTISSLGALGGNGFTPIVNAPEVAILGVSKAQMKPVWNGSEFIPRNMLPLTLSYDHRALNGADAGRFFTYLVNVLGDVRRLLL